MEQAIDASWLKRICLAAGADDAGFVPLESPALEAHRQEILSFFPATKALVSIAVRMNREPIRNPARSVANVEFHHVNDQANHAAHSIVRALEAAGVRAVNAAVGFPMEMDRFGEKTWVVSHKPVAVAAGLGRMGIHRSVIHPRFGSFILLSTVLVDRPISSYGTPIDWNPCVECKLCVAACPVGAIGSDGHFDFGACMTHNYREFHGGFIDWVGQVTDSRDAADYRRRVTDSETASIWQSLSFGANYKAAYCIAVCPAGEEVIAPFQQDRPQFVEQVVRPLQKREEPVYVVAGSDAEGHVRKRFPHKTVRRVHSGLRPRSIAGFLRGLPLIFQRGASKGVSAAFHFVFTGVEPREATVVIRDQKLTVESGLQGKADVRVQADSASWVRYLRRERGLLRLLLTRKLRISGRPSLLREFGRCFPS